MEAKKTKENKNPLKIEAEGGYTGIGNFWPL